MDNLQNQCFLFSSKVKNPEYFFQGYCFVGADYIFGINGANHFQQEKDAQIEGGEDGCYVIAKKENSQYVFSTDFSGNKKLFYYWTTDLWVVSNSIFLIAEHLKENNVVITVDYSQLAAIGIHKGDIFNQLYSVNTFIQGVKLLPTNSILTMSSSGYSIEKNLKKEVFGSYQEGLSVFIGTWVARLAGLLNCGIEVQSDLTGGADSRTVFTILREAAELCVDKENSPLFRSGLASNNTKDLEIAKKIGEVYGFNINEQSSSVLNGFSGKESYQSWKNLCLGVYHPIYFPSCAPQPYKVRLGGAGAENHRPFYKDIDSQTWINNNASKISPSWLSYNVSTEITAELERMINMGTNIDPMILHYREYRNRMHSGRTPQYIVLFNPLGSKILESVSEIAGSDRLKLGQINYDIMSTLLPDIMDIPFDNNLKNLNEKRKEKLLTLNEWFDVKPGKIYIDFHESSTIKKKTNSALELLNEDYQKAKENKFVRDFFGADFIIEADNLISETVSNRRFSHAIEGQRIAAIIAGSLFE